SQVFPHVFATGTMGGLWDEAGQYGMRMTDISRATEQVHIFATSQNFKYSQGYNNDFQMKPGTLGSEQVPQGFATMIEQAALLGAQIHGRPLESFVQDLAFDPEALRNEGDIQL